MRNDDVEDDDDDVEIKSSNIFGKYVCYLQYERTQGKQEMNE